MSHYVGFTEAGFEARCTALLASPPPPETGLTVEMARAARMVMIQTAESQRGLTEDQLDPDERPDRSELRAIRIAVSALIPPGLLLTAINWNAFGMAVARERNRLRWDEDEAATLVRIKREFQDWESGKSVRRIQESATHWLESRGAIH